MRRHLLASLFVVSAALVPATASAGGYTGGGSFGGSGGMRSNSSTNSYSASGANSGMSRSGSFGVGNLRFYTGGWKNGSNGEQRRSFGVAWVKKDGSSVKGFVKSDFRSDSTAGSTTIKGGKVDTSYVTQKGGSTTWGRESSDKKGTVAQWTTQSGSRTMGGSVSNTAAGEHSTKFGHDSSTGKTAWATNTNHSNGATTQTYHVNNAATGKVDRGYATVSSDGQLKNTWQQSASANGHVRTKESHENGYVGLRTTSGSAGFANGTGASSSYKTTTDMHNGDTWRSSTAKVGNLTQDRSSSATTNQNGDRVYQQSHATTTVVPKGTPERSAPVHVSSTRVGSSEQSATPAPMKALPAGVSTVNKHVEGKEGGVSVKDTIAKVAPGGLTGKHSAPESSPKHAL